MKILAIDCSSDACSVAFFGDSNLVIERFVVAAKAHARLLLPMVDEVLGELQIECQQLDVIAFGKGPGSFTGIRLAASVVMGLAAPFDLPVVGVSSLQALAQEVFEELGHERVIVAQDAKMQELYWGEYHVENGIMCPIVPDKLRSYHDVIVIPDNFVVAGDFFAMTVANRACIDLKKIVAKKYVNAKYILPIAFEIVQQERAENVDDISPVYLRDKSAWAK